MDRDNKQAQFRRMGIMTAKTEDEDTIKELRSQVTMLQSTLEKERAAHFRSIQDIKLRQTALDADQNRELAAQSRKLAEQRITHLNEIKRIETECDKKMASVKANVVKDAKVQQGKVYEEVRKLVEEEVKTDFELRRGELYDALHKDIRGQVVKELHEQDSREKIEISKVENAFYVKYRELVETINKQVEKYYHELREDTEKLLLQHQAELSERHERSVADQTADWLSRNAEREKEWMEKAMQDDEARMVHEREVVASFKIASDKANQRIQEALMAKREEIVKQLSDNLSILENVKEGIVNESITSTERIHSSLISKQQELSKQLDDNLKQFTKIKEEITNGSIEASERINQQLVERQKQLSQQMNDNFEKLSSEKLALHNEYEEKMNELMHSFEERQMKDKVAQKELTAQLQVTHRDQIQALEAALLHEREIYNASLKELNEMHQAERSNFQAVVEAEQQRQAEYQRQFEQELRNQYDLMASTLRQQVKTEGDSRIKRAVVDLANQSAVEEQKLAAAQQATHDAQSAAVVECRRLLAEAQERWRMEEDKRVASLTQQLQQQQSAAVQDVEAQLAHSLELNQLAEQQWQQQTAASSRQHLEALRQFEQKCIRLFQSRLDDYLARNEQQLQEMQLKLLHHAAYEAEMKSQLEQRTADAKSDLAAFKLDFVSKKEAEFDTRAQQLTKRFTETIDSLSQQLDEARAKASLELEVRQQLAQDNREKLQQMEQQRLLQQEEAAMRTYKEATAQVELQRQRETLVKLWEITETNVNDCAPFLLQVFNNFAYSDKLMKMVERENVMISDSLPLLKLATRREFLKYRIQCIHRFATDPINHADFGGTMDDSNPEMAENSRDLLMSELHIIDKRLTTSIDQYEKTYETQFVFRGERYLDILNKEKVFMPEKIIADSALDEKSEEILKAIDETETW